jgi:hypothetical protein
MVVFVFKLYVIQDQYIIIPSVGIPAMAKMGITKEFMSKVTDYKRIVLGETEQYFLFAFAVSRELSASDICSSLQRQGKPMSYKNVHRRVARLHKLGMLEKAENNYRQWEHNAIKYRLTSRGLIERLLLSRPPIPYSWDLYKDDIVMQTMLYQFFEFETIRKFRSPAIALIADYLKNCYEAIVRRIEGWRTSIKKFPEVLSNSKGKRRLLEAEMDKLIRDQIKNLVLRIVTLSNYDEAKTCSFFPIAALKKDKKFMKTLLEIKKDFEGGCKKFT